VSFVKFGACTLVTGASSGLGAAFARELASHGNDLILIARREERLRALASELGERWGINVDVWPADLTDAASLEAIAGRIEALPGLELLVNNAGVGGAGFFVEEPPGAQQAMIALHVAATTRLCRAALPGMTQRGMGGIINVASLAAFVSLPGSVLYCATKAYIVSLSRTLALETRGSGVRVQALCPGFIHTEFHDSLDRRRFDPDRIPAFLWSTPEDVVASSLDALERGKAICVPGAQYRLIYALARAGLAQPALSLAQRRRGRL
jgi:short-subunit dehydrogenase